jgi:hypothetical protein
MNGQNLSWIRENREELACRSATCEIDDYIGFVIGESGKPTEMFSGARRWSWSSLMT